MAFQAISRVISISLLAALAQFPVLIATAADANLGLAIDVLPSSDPEISRLTQGQALWFVIPPGSSKSRQVRVTSSSSISQEIELSVGYLNRIDGVATIDDSKESETKDWAEFSPNKFTLGPRASQLVDFTYKIPADIEIGIHEAFLFATASKVASKNNPEYRVPQKARIASPIFLGVGTSAQISTDFSIDDVNGVVVNGMRQLKIDFKNIGKTPLSLSGTIQLSSAEFQNNLVGPLSFNSVVIRPGVLGYVLVPAPEQLTSGKWKILVSATQISTTKTREFTKDLTFRPPSALLQNSLRVLAAIFFFLLFAFAMRVLRAPRKKVQAQEKEVTKPIRMRRKLRLNSASKVSVEEAELENLIEDLLARRATQATTPARRVAKKAPAKKAPAKKAPAKKAPAKKAPAKKAPAKKAPAKKAPAKKAGRKQAQ